MRFTGKTVVVTGAGSGIGAETARMFAAEGANVVVADIDPSAATRVSSGVAGSVALEVDVTSRESLREMFQATVALNGGVDVLVNNAATCSDTPFLDISADEVRRDLAVGLLGPIFASQEVLPGMIERAGGVILNVGSVNGLFYFGNPAYSAAKAGLVSLTKSIAVQFGRFGIRCNGVAPGTVATPAWDRRLELDPHVLERTSQWYPLGRVGAPADVAESLMFLASDAASWITGVVLPVEGGLTSGNLAFAVEAAPVESEAGTAD